MILCTVLGSVKVTDEVVINWIVLKLLIVIQST